MALGSDVLTLVTRFVTDMPFCGRPRKPRPLNQMIQFSTLRQDIRLPDGLTKDLIVPPLLNPSLPYSMFHSVIYDTGGQQKASLQLGRCHRQDVCSTPLLSVSASRDDLR